jgi:hypothetical protein|tara:strand:- start:605 stop:976 length:372 start_codon:yes stop_codon:yes gene_type:complete
MLQALIGPITNMVGGYMKNKAAQSAAKHEAKMNVIQNDADWESKMADSSANSWKDEFWTIVLAIPIFMVGYAIVADDMSVVARVEAAFAALTGLPEWYQYLLFIAISSSFGIKGASKLMGMRK